MDGEKADTDFKHQVFANNPPLYKQLFADEDTLDEDEINYVTPKDESEFNTMLKDLKSFGIIDQ